MQRLKILLKGEAAKLIAHFNCTEDSYDDALEQLKNRYENKRLIFEGLVDKLLDQPNLKSDKAANIRLLLDTTTSSIKSLVKMGIDVEAVKPFIARIIIRKFDSEAIKQYEYCTRKTRSIQTLEDVFGFLEQMAQAQETVKAKKDQSTQQPSYQKTGSRQTNAFSTEATAMCVFCKNKGHRIGDCRKFLQLSPYDRKSWANKNKMCLICLCHTSEKRCYKYQHKLRVMKFLKSMHWYYPNH